MGVDKLFPCFPIPIEVHNFQKETHDLNVQLMNDIYYELENSGGVVASNVGGWHSESDLHTRFPSFQSLMNIINNALNQYCDKHGYESGLVCKRIWANLNRENEYNMPHHHGNNAMTGVYYPVKQVIGDLYEFNYSENVSLQLGTYDGEQGGCLTIQDPSYGMKTKLRKKKQYKAFTADHYHYYPVAGTLVLMPSYLVHSVLPFQGEGERVSISFSCDYGDY